MKHKYMPGVSILNEIWCWKKIHNLMTETVGLYWNEMYCWRQIDFFLTLKVGNKRIREAFSLSKWEQLDQWQKPKRVKGQSKESNILSYNRVKRQHQ